MKGVGLILSSMLGLASIGCSAHAQEQKCWVGAGDLTVEGRDPIPLKHTDVKIKVGGMVASVRVEQLFTNPYQEPVEAIYTFPLPSDSAVNDMSVRIGDRTIRSLIKPRDEAVKMYQHARQAGQVAGLLEQERPNIFTTSLANIQPGDDIHIQIEYVQRLAYDAGGVTIRFPMVVAPRYIPGAPTKTDAAGRTDSTEVVPDASRITPPVLKPDQRPGYDISLSVDIDAGLPVKNLQSPSHPVSLSELGPGLYHVELSRAHEIPNRDFILHYALAGPTPKVAVLTAPGTDGGAYFMLMALPPAGIPTEGIFPRDITFIIDTSGSMSGSKIEQARNALQNLVHGLNPQDSFNIIRFSNDFSSFSTGPVPFTQDNVDRADSFIDRLQAQGGTEMLPPLLEALKAPREAGRLSMIVFLTDAQIGNERQILRAIQDHLGNARLHSLGVDVAPNDYLLRKMAELGRGTVEFILPHQHLEESIARFQNRIGSPVLTDIEIDWKTVKADWVYPPRPPDVYLAQPVVVCGKASHAGTHTISLRGKTNAGPFATSVRIDFDRPTVEPTALSSLCARSRIEGLVDQLTMHPEDQDSTEEVIRLAISHRLMSPFTSFVAIEEQVIPSSDGGPPKTVVVPVPLPEGWDYEAVFGRKKNGRSAGAPLNRIGITSSNRQFAPSAGIVGGISDARLEAPSQSSADRSQNAAGMRPDMGGHDREHLTRPVTRDEAVQAVSRYLARRQRVDGSWEDRTKATALILLAWLANGHTDRGGHYQVQVRRAQDFLVKSINTGASREKSGSSIQSRAVTLWALAESSVVTRSQRFQSAAEALASGLLHDRMSSGLWPRHVGGPADPAATAWACLALKSHLKAGLRLDPDVLNIAARSITQLPQASVIEKALVQFVAGQIPNPDLVSELTADLSHRKWQIQASAQAEQAMLAALVTHWLDEQLQRHVEDQLFNALAGYQVHHGKDSGGFQIVTGSLIPASAQAHFLLSSTRASWEALR